MEEKILKKYKSRRNSAGLVQTEAGLFVVKTFPEAGSFQRELH